MAQVCPYCRAPVLPEDATTSCEGCGTPHHSECYAENGGCTLFGCKFAPPDDPKVQVSSHEILQAAAPVAYGAAAGTGFGDVTAPLSLVPPSWPAPPPPPPPPRLDGEPALETPLPSLVPAASFLLAATERPAKSRLTFILLGIFLGSFGVHNFYAGYTKRGIAQLCVTLGTFFYGSFVTWAWALIEVCTVDRDRNNVAFV